MPPSFQLLDGKFVSSELKKSLSVGVAEFKKLYGRTPSLHVVIVGQDPASQIYVGHKEKAAAQIGIESRVHRLSSTTTQTEVESLVLQLAQESHVDGILVQMPIPKHLNSARINELIPFEKDVDGFSSQALGALCLNNAKAVACTPAGVMELLDFYKIQVQGMDAVVIGRSTIVGKPMALLLLNAGATVTVCHTKTKDLYSHVRNADLVVVAAGKPEFLNVSHFKKGSIVIDVGIHRDSNQKIVGDVKSEGLEKHVSAASPVPGGVGPMTIAMLLKNTLTLAHDRMKV